MANFYINVIFYRIKRSLKPLFLTGAFLFLSTTLLHAQKAVQLVDHSEASPFPYQQSPALEQSPILTTNADGDDCNQETPSNDQEDGLGNLHLLIFANDFTVNAGENFTLDSLQTNLLLETDETVNSVEVHLYSDSGNGPGEEISSQTGLEPDSQENIGEAFDFDVIKMKLSFDTPFELEGGAGETIYWIGIKIDYDGESSYMEATTTINTADEIYYYDEDNENWIPSSAPESDNGFGEAYDGVIAFYGECTELDACTGEPEAGEISGDDSFGICENTALTLSVTGTTEASGMTLQWQEKHPDGDDTWADIEGANDLTLSVADGITENTDYRFKVTCDASGDSDMTNVVSVTLNPSEECYCTPTTTGNSSSIDDFTATGDLGEDIENLGTGNSETGEGYSDFTDQVVQVTATQELSYTLNTTSGSAGLKIWVDWGQDGDFNEDDELMYQSDSYSTSYEGSFQIPEDADGEYRMRVGTSYIPSSGPDGPCSHSNNGEYEDYTIEVTPLEDCEGTPTAGTADDDFSVCAGNAFDLNTTDASGSANNLRRVWQSSPAGEDDWEDLSDSNQNPTYTLEDGIMEPTDFRYKLQCGDDDPVYSDIIEVTLNPGTECYCTPEYSTGCTSGDQITNVSLTGESESLNNSSECSPDAYSDYSDSTDVAQPDLAPGETYTVSVSTDYSSPNYEQVKIWIDYDENGQFSDDEEIANTAGDGLAGGTGNFDFTASETADPGTYKMRVRLVYGSSDPTFDACSSETYGETEDYTIEIIQLEDCEGTPTAGTVDDDFSVCAGNAFDISTSGASDPANGLDRVWQYSPAGENNWTDIEEAHSNTFTVDTGVTVATDFRYKVTCNNSEETDTSDVVSVTLNPSSECYCTPGASSSNYISSLSTSGAVNNIDITNAEASPNGYFDNTSTDTISQVQTVPLDFSASYTSGTFGSKIWVDWNHDGQFSSDEIVYQSSSYSGEASGSFAPPEDAELGTTRMRIGIHWLNSGGPQPCDTDSNTSFMDVTFEVIPLEDCEGIPTAGTADEDFSVCAGNAFDLNTTGASDPANGQDRIWQSSPAGEDTWTDIEGASAANYTLEDGIEEPTDFRYKVVCNFSEESDISEVIHVTLNPALECYCIPSNSYTELYYISEFSTDGALQDIDKSSGFSDGGYADYTETDTLIVYPGQEFDFSIRSGPSTTFNYQVWMDMNQNGNFDDEGENIISSEDYVSNPFVGTYTIPTDLDAGSYRLRLRNALLSAPAPSCGEFDYGEAEDYIVKVINPECFPPVDITIDYITDNSAQVNWLANDEDSWEVTYGPEGFDPNDEEVGTSITINGDPQADIEELETDSIYDVYVKTLCVGDEESIMLGPNTFTTNVTPPENTRLCNAIELTPNAACSPGTYTTANAFEQVGEPVGSCYNNYRGTNSVWFTFEATDTTATLDTDYDPTDFATEITVYEAPSDCEDLTTLGEQIGCATGNADELVLHDLTIGDTYYVRVAGFNNTAGTFCINLDMEEQSCDTPSDIIVNVIDHSSAEVSWTPGGNESQWEVLYGEHGFNPGQDGQSQMVSNATETTLEGLEADTQYDVYVRAICNENTQSNWTGPKSFNTPLGVDHQVFENFTYYPNPVKGQLTLKANAPIESVTVFNLLGQQVISVTPNTLETQVNTEDLQADVYLMKVNINGSHKTFRIIKK